MSRKYFGTDGVRGRVGQAPITPDFVMRLGYAAGKVLLGQAEVGDGERPSVLIGKDTRLSGYMLESALGGRFFGCRRRCLSGRPDTDTGGRLSDAGAASAGGNRDFRVAQPVLR